MNREKSLDGWNLEHSLEVTATVMIALATIFSAWSIYEANQWSAVQFIEQADANVQRTESTRESNRANFQTQVDVQLFSQWVAAVRANDTQLSTFLEERFRPEFLPAFYAWLDQAPEGEIPPGSPFDLPEYQLASRIESDRLLEQAQSSMQASLRANELNGKYILTTVLFASVLFLSGIQSKLYSKNLRKWILALALIVLVIGIATLLSLPIRIG